MPSSSCLTYTSLANKENWIPPSVPFIRLSKKAKPTAKGGITKPLANKALRQFELPQDHPLMMAEEVEIKILLDKFTRNILNQKAKELTQLPLGDLSEAYSLQGFHEG